MKSHRVSTDVIVAADTRISRVLNGGYATTPIMKLFREIDTHLHFSMPDASLTQIELAFGWLIEQGRILLECNGTNAWAHYRASEPLVFDAPILRLSFDDTPTFVALTSAEMTAREANRNLAVAQRKAREAQLALTGIYDRIRFTAPAFR